MLKAVLFDLDGTLIDSTDAIVASYFHMFDVVGLPRLSREQILAGLGHPLEVEAEALALAHGVDAQRCVDVYRQHYGAVAPDSTTLLPGGREILAACAAAGLACGLRVSALIWALI